MDQYSLKTTVGYPALVKLVVGRARYSFTKFTKPGYPTVIYLRKLLQLVKYSLHSHPFECVSVAFISCCQGMILVCWDLASRLENIEELQGVKIPFALFLDALNHRNIVHVLVKTSTTIIILFFLEYGFVLIYVCFRSARSRQKFALFMWLLPGLLLLPTIVGTVLYILSPGFSIFLLPSIIGGELTKEDIAEGWVFPVAAIGWFNLFWFGTILQCWLTEFSQ